MAGPSRDADREQLERELGSNEYMELIRDLRQDEPGLGGLATWADVIAFMRTGAPAESRKDDVLRSILRAHAQDHDPRWRTVLLAMFWPGLESISRKREHWDDDPDELWQNAVWSFLQAVCRLDVSRRPSRLAQKLVNDTIHRLHDEYRQRWSRTKPEIPVDPDELEALAGGTCGIDLEAIDLRQAHQREVARLREHLEAGHITEGDFLLLVGTRLYGQSIAEYARTAGLSYEVAKKHRQRAEARIRRHEHEMQRSSENVSPSSAIDPLLLCGDE